MTAAIKTILVIGGTSGIGESFARRFHAQGKKVIITGRREDRLKKIASELSGHSYVMDNSDFASIPKHVDTIFDQYPDIDSVWINSGVQYAPDMKDQSSSSDARIIEEVNVNLTAPILFSRYIVPRLIASPAKETNFLITSSGIAFVPSPVYPIYSATKAGIHAFLISLRVQLKTTKVNVIEIAPPYVSTALDEAHRHITAGVVTPLSMDEYTNGTFETLDKTNARDLKEVGVKSSTDRANLWRDSIGKRMETMGLSDSKA